MSEAQQATFTFELVSPERKLMSGPVAFVAVPGEEGGFGVLPGHAALVATIRPGVIEVRGADGETRRIFVAGGFADVSPTNCTVLAEEAINVADLNRAELEQTIRNLTEDMAMATDALEKSRIDRRLKLARAKLQGVMGAAA